MFKQAIFIMIAISLLAVVAITIQTFNNANALESKVIPVCTGKGKTSTASTPTNPVTPVSKYSSLAEIWA